MRMHPRPRPKQKALENISQGKKMNMNLLTILVEEGKEIFTFGINN